MSANIQDGGSDTPSRKRTLDEFLVNAKSDAVKAAAAGPKPLTPSKLRLVTGVENINDNDAKQPQVEIDLISPSSPRPPRSPRSPEAPDSPLSEMSDGPMSLLTDAGSSTPVRRSLSPNATPCKSLSGGGSPELVVISTDATPPAGSSSYPLKALPSAAAQPPPAKRKRLTPSEREEKAKADAARKLEREKAELAKKQEKERLEAVKKQERDEQKAAADAKKKALADEKEKKRKQKEDEDRRKADEKEKKRKEKEDEERKIQEAKNKKERSQLRLNSFFRTGGANNSSSVAASSLSLSSAAATTTTASGPLIPGGSPLKAVMTARSLSASPQKRASGGTGAGAAGTPDAQAPLVEVSEYDRVFKPFFIKENVIMATSLFGMDDETKETKSRILDEHLSGTRGAFVPPKPFTTKSAIDYFHLPCDQNERPLPRGRTRPTVRKIMNMMSSDTQDTQTKLALDMLKSIPMKYLFFREDVRPAYFGTVTSQPPQARLSKLARNPLAKTVLPLNYDYDSEAEWVDDGDGEDVDDLDDDEEELDEDGEMSDFLDDSEDAIPLRPAFSGGMEPESTGICWENERWKTPRPELDAFRMEFILGELSITAGYVSRFIHLRDHRLTRADHNGPFDPFSTQYWEAPEPKPAEVPSAASNAPGKAMAPPTGPADAFSVLSAALGTTANGSVVSSSTAAPAAGVATTSAPASGKAVDPKKVAGVGAEYVPDFKKSILQYSKLSKVGIVEILSAEFMGKCTKSQIKNSLEALAERTGAGQHKTWKLKS